jgi:hypothetical protein
MEPSGAGKDTHNASIQDLFAIRVGCLRAAGGKDRACGQSDGKGGNAFQCGFAFHA